MLVSGEQVVWRYHVRFAMSRRSRPCFIAAEVVQDGPLRVRIRIPLASGGTALRWVKPDYLLRPRPDMRGEPYPDR